MEEGGLYEQAGFLDIPTYKASLVLAMFLLASMAFEKATHWLVHFFRKRKRMGLAQAASNLVTELTLVGFIAMLLTVLQGPISRICVSYSPSAYNRWALISNVEGCDCCVAATKSLGACFMRQRDCGPDYCNCDGQDPACAVPKPTLEQALDELRGNGTCLAEPCRPFLESAASSSQAITVGELLRLNCDGQAELGAGHCGQGKAPLVSVVAQHQIHLFIFAVAVTHVVMAGLMVALASARVYRWRRQCGDEDDEHARSVRQLLARQRTAAPASPEPWHRLSLVKEFGSTLKRKLSMMSSRGWRSASQPVSLSATAADQAERGVNGRQSLDIPAGSPRLSGSPLAAAQLAATNSSPIRSSALAVGASSPGSQAKIEAVRVPAAAGGAAAEGEQGGDAGAGAEGRLPTIGEGGSKLGSSQAGGSRSLLQSLEGSSQASQGHLAEHLGEGGAGAGEEGAAPTVGGEAREHRPRSEFFQRSATIQQGDVVARLRELGICLLHQFNPVPVAGEDIRLMRASFMLTHRVPEGFDFWAYIGESMEDDFSRVVGMGFEMWFTIIVFLLLSGPLGWATLLLICLAAAVLLVVNVKLFSIIRHVCRGCRANTLTLDAFWFRRPGLLLVPIRFLLFFTSFTFSAPIFFAWTAGAKSCPFTSHNNSFWFAWKAPWWCTLVFGGVIFLDVSLRTLPCYSLAVQMGSNAKHHMLPRGVREKLLRIALRVKKRRRGEMAEEAAAHESGLVGVQLASICHPATDRHHESQTLTGDQHRDAHTR